MNYSMSTFQLVVQKRLFSSKNLGINGLTWGIIILPIFTALLIKTRQEKNAIKFLLDGNGNRVEEVDLIKDLVVDFYQKMLGSSNDVDEAAMIQTVSSLF